MANLVWQRGKQICPGAFARKIREYYLQDMSNEHVHLRVYWSVRDNTWSWQAIGKSTEPRLNSVIAYSSAGAALSDAKRWWKHNGDKHLAKFKEN